jgi:hypothetical protein
MWGLFDDVLRWPVTLLPIQRISRADLGAYNAIVLPDASRDGGARLREIVGGANWNRLLDWVSFGGTLVVCGESIGAFPTDPLEDPRVHIRVRRDILDQVPALGRRVAGSRAARARLASPGVAIGGDTHAERPIWVLPTFVNPEETLAWDERQRRFAPRGVLMRVESDPRHWLCAGLGADPAVPVWTTHAYHALAPAEAIGRLALGDQLCAAGVLWPEARRRWEGTVAIARERLGSGQIIAIAGDFKLGTPVLERVALNATVLGPTLGARPTGGY